MFEMKLVMFECENCNNNTFLLFHNQKATMSSFNSVDIRFLRKVHMILVLPLMTLRIL